MTALDPFTAASPSYRAAIRHPHKSGEAFEVTGRTSFEGHRLAFWLGGIAGTAAALIGLVVR